MFLGARCAFVYTQFLQNGIQRRILLFSLLSQKLACGCIFVKEN
ncbi:hypothetical protein HMPREF9075_02416 [Capnocytophaga sp. oral taxon 332 str. F0381]|nr:hypothetical protein HMPREF9075_02416 [Capnocytophaga sp. oral taxon 332 str. F0381]